MSRFVTKAAPFKVDKDSGYIITLSPEHAARHRGEAFAFSYNIGPISINGFTQLLFKTSTNANIETGFQKTRIASDNTIRTFFIENVTFTTEGVELPLIQRNRNSTTLPATRVYVTTSQFTSTGTTLRTLIFDQGRNAVEDDEGWSLKSDTWYALRIFNMGVSITSYCNFITMIFETRR